MGSAKKARIAIRYYPEDGQYNVSDIDPGPLVGGLTEEPLRLARGTHEDGRVKLEIERTHEWEYLIGLFIVGSGAFTKAVLETVGKRVGNWIADQVEMQLKDELVKIRSDDGETIEIDPDNPAAARTAYTKAIENAAERGGTVVILFPG